MGSRRLLHCNREEKDTLKGGVKVIVVFPERGIFFFGSRLTAQCPRHAESQVRMVDLAAQKASQVAQTAGVRWAANLFDGNAMLFTTVSCVSAIYSFKPCVTPLGQTGVEVGWLGGGGSRVSGWVGASGLPGGTPWVRF